MTDVKKISVADAKEKMGKVSCPNCLVNIDCLEMVQTGVQSANLYLSDKKIVPEELARTAQEMRAPPIEYLDVEFEGDGQVTDYKCPFCHKTLFSSEDEAVDFLAGIPKITEAIL